VAGLFAGGACFAQPTQPCFAFLLRGDVTVVCKGTSTQITRRGDIENFAVSDELSSLAYRTSVDSASVVDLKTGRLRLGEGMTGLVSTCGGIMPNQVGSRAGTRELVTGEDLDFGPYLRIRCSTDQRVVIGITVSGDLYEGFRRPFDWRRPPTYIHTSSTSVRMDRRSPGTTMSGRSAFSRAPTAQCNALSMLL
jgi:hypothetical protein